MHCFGIIVIAFYNIRGFLLFSKFVEMDLVSLEQVFIIWMLFSITLGNCATSKSKVCNVFSNLNRNIIGFNVSPMFFADVNRKGHPPHFWWK